MSSEDVDLDIVRLIRLTGMREHELTQARKEKNGQWTRVESITQAHEHFISMAEKHTRQKAVQDPVHGAILLEPWELDVISGWEMLRLRYVRQLGPAHIVYPGATHTRFQHCLGTNYLAQKCIKVVNYCEDLSKPCFVPLTELLDEYQQKIFRTAALLHDVGHPPTSHTIEFSLRMWVGLDHSDLGEFLILHSDLTDTLERNGIEGKTVVDILRRRTSDAVLSLMSDFLDSPLDIDKTDYLIRDAHFSGVQLGVFPAERVLLTNRVARNEEGRFVRAFMLKALHSLEALILSRNWMFSDLYLHHAVRLAEALVSKATYFRLREEGLSKSECIGLFTRMTDGDLFRWLEKSEIDFVREYAARIRYRRLFKVVLSRPLAAFDSDAKGRLMDMEENIENLLEAELELVDDPGSCVIDIVNPELGERFLSEIPVLVGGETGLDLVSLEQTDEGRPLMQILKQQRLTIPSVRVYADRKHYDNVREKFDKIFPLERKPNYRENEYDLIDY
ncbi:MAG: HD domain-containing protein [Candidatus Thorarchaeota archaeon]|nr:MAG: HD domain-containing protein [Candidatus Thorarchaeota archaeon]